MDEKIKNLLDSVSYIPVLDSGVPDVIPCVTYHLYNENGLLFGAGEATQEGVSCQVDIWYREKTAEVIDTIKAIKNALKAEKNFTYPIGDSSYDSTNKIRHKYFTFEIFIESEE